MRANFRSDSFSLNVYKPYKVAIIPFLQMRKLEFKKIKQLAQDHTAANQ